MTDNKQYFYLKLGIPRGPFSWSEFVQLAKDEKIKAKTPCIRNDAPSLPASEFFGENWGKIESLVLRRKQEIADEKLRAREALEIEREQRKLAADAERQKLEQERNEELASQELQKQQAAQLAQIQKQATEQRLATGAASAASPDYQTKSVIGIIGSGCLILGVFLPIIRLPFVGSIDYFRGGEGDGVIIMALGAIAVVLTLCRSFLLLWIPGVAALGIMAYSILNFFGVMAQARESLNDDLAGNPFRGIGEAMVGSVTLDWGWIVLIGGGVLLCVSSGLKPSVKPYS